MSSIILVLFGLGIFFLGYKFYSHFIESRIYGISDPDLVTPAHEFEDGIDFLPTKRHILFGHHFTSIAGAAPIIGPCVAAYWGWLPALVWVVLGTVFMGAVHDFGALVVSIKEKGRSIADITASVISSRTRIMFLIFVMMLIWLVLAVFAMAIADLFVSIPSSVLPINIQIIVALIIGWIIYKKGMNSFIPSIIALGVLYLFVWLGTQIPLSFSLLGWAKDQQTSAWIIILFIYSGIASLLPVWLLLQPRDYINSHQLLVGLGLIFLGIAVANPIIQAPIIRTSFEASAPSIFPLLFVTIACGAISGFHGLVSSGTTSKQINSITDARLIGYGGMIGEGTLALASIICAVAGIGLVSTCTLPAIGAVSDLTWSVYYDSWAHASANKATAFVLGGGALLESLGISPELAKTLMAVLVIAFAATTLDTATRIQRFIITELAIVLRFKFLTNRYVATIAAILPAILLVFVNVSLPSSTEAKQVAWVLWPIFGASNQMLAALTLMVLTLYFWQKNKPVLALLIPMILVMLVTIVTLCVKAMEFYSQNTILFVINLFMIGLVMWMIVEGIIVFQKKRKINVNS
ncbi:MAG: carbon starvation protein A [Candidatus Neomarinimicrobiota bacterium]|nr:carbon starvation protein A [Candidatus Neomarinimicrobiota bacterium]